MKLRENYLNPKIWLSKSRIICGIMSGTSLDGIDVALVRFEKKKNFNFELINFETFNFSEEFISNLKSLITEKNYVSLISKLHFQISYEYLSAINALSKKTKISLKNIDLISIHGQTVWHDPIAKIPNSLQIANPSVISNNLNIPVVFDFRSADIVVGGQGAPLVPIFDFHFLRHKNKNRIALNIGGISNITYLPKDSTKIIAFDTGPGNILIDYYTQKYFNQDFDKNGGLAKKGKTNKKLLEKLMSLQFIKQSPPKSTGRELFNPKLINSLLLKSEFDNIKPLDLINTLTNYTVKSIAYNIESFTKNIDEIIVSGGGAKNKFMMQLLKENIKTKIINSSEIGINPDAKESIAFAFLAYLNLAQIPGNIPSVTGARQKVILGNISLPF